MEITDIQLKSLEQQLENARILGCEEEFLKAYGVDIEKARSGVYANTAENKKLGRVGQKYGSVKEEFKGKYDDWTAQQHTEQSWQHHGAMIRARKDKNPSLARYEESAMNEHISMAAQKAKKEVKKSSVEHEHNLKEGEQVRTAGGKLQRVVEIVGNSVRLSGQNDTVHITKLFRSNGEAVISNKKKDQSKPTIHIGDMSEEQMHEQAKKLGISGHKSMSSQELAKKLTDANIDKQLAEFKSRKK